MSFGGQPPTSAFGGGGQGAFDSTSPFRGGYSGRGGGGGRSGVTNAGFRGGGRGGFSNKTYIAPALQGGGGAAAGGDVTSTNGMDMDTMDQQSQGFANASRGRGRGGGGGTSNVGRGGFHHHAAINTSTNNNQVNAFGAPSVRGRKQGMQFRSLQWRADDAQNSSNASQSAMTSTGFTSNSSSSSLEPQNAATGSAFGGFGGGGDGGGGVSLSTSGANSAFNAGASSAFSSAGNTNNAGAFSALDSGRASSSFASASTSAVGGAMQSGGNNHNKPAKEKSIFNQDDADSRLARFSAVPIGNRYEELKEKRVIEREKAIQSGAIPDPNKPRRLEDAIQFVGTCLDMCPEFERHEREYQQSLEKFEKIPGTESVDHGRAVKVFARPAAGADQPLPSDVRPPHVLLSTLAYLVKHVIDENDLLDSHSFIRDRTRSIRQDFTLQNNRGIEAVQAHEVIARYHILCLHQLCEEEGERFSQQQEMEQLRKVLTSLQEFYDDLRSENVYCENEAEFRAYHILSHLHDPDMLRQAQQLPQHLFNDPFIRIATEIQYMTRRNNDFLRRGKVQSEASPNFYSRFFKKVASPTTSYLFACLLEVSFVEIRKGALKAMNKAFLEIHGGYPVEELMDTLGFDDLDECITNCQEYGLEIDTSRGQPMVLFGRRDQVTRQFLFQESTIPLKQHRNVRIVEAKRAGYTATQIIFGETPPPMLKGVKAVRPPPTPSTRPSLARLNPAASSFTPGARVASKPTAGPSVSAQTQSSIFGLTTQPAQSAFSMQPPAAKPSLLSLPPSSAPSQFTVPNQPAAAPFNFGIASTSMSAPPSISTSLSAPSFPAPSTAPFFQKPTPVPAVTQETRSTFPIAPIPNAQIAPTFAITQSTAPAAIPSFQVPLTNLSAAPAISFQPPAPAPALNLAPTLTPTVSTALQGQPAALPLFSAPPPATLVLKPKSDETRVVAASGTIYPRSTINHVMEDLIQAALSGYIRSVVAEAQHDEKLHRSMEHSRLRQQQLHQESRALCDKTLDYAVRLMVSDVATEMLREFRLSQKVVQRWRRFTAAARARKQELQRRQRSFMRNVQAMSSRAGLGDNPVKTQLKAYQEEQRRSMRRYNGVMQNGQAEAAATAGLDGQGVKALVLATWQRQQQLRAEAIKEVGNADQAMLHQVEMLSAPKRERWAALDVHAIVQKGWQSTHSTAMTRSGQGDFSERRHQLQKPVFKVRWSLQVNTPSLQENASQWVFSKLGVDINSQSRTLYREHVGEPDGMDVIICGTDDHSVAELLQVSKNIIAETSAFLFVFSNIPFTEDEASEDSIRRYWRREHDRLSGFLSCFPKVRQPIVLVMWGQSKSVWETMSPRMTEYLGLDKMVAAENGPILAYQLVFMTTREPNPSRFIEGSLDWLAKASRVVDENPQVALQDLFNKFLPYYEGTLARMSVSQAPMYSQYEADKADSAFYDAYQESQNPDESSNLFVETVESALSLAVKNFNLLLDHVAAVVESTGVGDDLRQGAQQEQEVKKGIVCLIRESRLPIVFQGRFLDHIGFDLDARESFCDYMDCYVSTIAGVAKDQTNAKALKQLRKGLRSIIMNSRVDRTPIFEVMKLLTATISQWVQGAILKQWGKTPAVGTLGFALAFGRWLVGDEVDVQDFVSQYETLVDANVHAWENKVMDRVAKYDERAEFIKAMKQYQEHRSAAAASRMEEMDVDLDLDEEEEEEEKVQQQQQQQGSIRLLTNGGLKRNAPVDSEQERDKRAKTLSNLALLTKAAAAAAAAGVQSETLTNNTVNSDSIQQKLLSAFGANNIRTMDASSLGTNSFVPQVQMGLGRPRRGSVASMASVASSVNSTSSKRDDLMTRLSNRIKEVKSTILRK